MNQKDKMPKLEQILEQILIKYSQKNMDLTQEKLSILSIKEDWSHVNMEMLSNIFEQFFTKKERHIYGIYYTSEHDIMQIVKPTISNYWLEKINNTNSMNELHKLHLELQNYKILDPACGSGNFLYVAYVELKRIEQILINKINPKKSGDQEKINRGFITLNQFYGMDINPFAVELAKVTLIIAQKVAIALFNLTEYALNLELNNNIICKDALFTNWINADAIIGNPPFLGGKKLRILLGDDYVNKLFTQFPNIKNVDFCSYWFRIAHDHINQNGRVGLVATNSICQGKSRAVSLDYITENGGYIYHAISHQEWSGAAQVYVSIVNWCKIKPEYYILDGKEVSHINSSLTSVIDVTKAKILKSNLNQCFQGVIPVGMGFIINAQKAQNWIKINQKNNQVLKLFSMGKNLAQNVNGIPDRWIIDFNDMSLEDASKYDLPFAHIQTYVKPERLTNRSERARDFWWQFGSKAPSLRRVISHLSYYFAVPRVSKWAIFIPINKNFLPGDKSVVVATEDYYILGILTSKIHRVWMNAQKSTLEDRIAYTHTTCFETFPFPQIPDTKIVKNIRKLMLELHEYRSNEMENKGWGITQLYNQYYHETASKLYEYHQILDTLVLEVYNLKSDDNILEKLFQFNQELGEKE